MVTLSNVLNYLGYRAVVQYSSEDGVLFGKIEGIKDLVSFEADSASQVEAEFHSAVDDYLAVCKELGQEPDKPYSGSFNVRVSSDLHRAASMMAIDQGTSLNQIVETALQKYVYEKEEPKVSVTINLSSEQAESILPNYATKPRLHAVC